MWTHPSGISHVTTPPVNRLIAKMAPHRFDLRQSFFDHAMLNIRNIKRENTRQTIVSQEKNEAVNDINSVAVDDLNSYNSKGIQLFYSHRDYQSP